MLTPRSKFVKLVIQLFCVGIGAVLAVLIAIPLLGPGWHSLHGDAIFFGGWRVPVPRGFYVRQSATETMMWKQSFGVPFFDVPYGHISLFRRPPQQLFLFDRDYGKFKSRLANDANQKGYELTSERTLQVGGKPAHCLVFTRSSPAASLVRCAVEGSALALFYEGDARYLSDVFATLQGISTDS